MPAHLIANRLHVYFKQVSTHSGQKGFVKSRTFFCGIGVLDYAS